MNKVSLIACLLFCFGCKEPFNSPILSQAPHYLVVDGVSQADDGSGIIRLSRTRDLNDSIKNLPESGAQVSLINSFSNYIFSETVGGEYRVDLSTLDPTQAYKLFIRTSDGREYMSDSIFPKQAPPIDSLGWRLAQEGVTIYLNTHDDSKNSRYYRWEYTETWEHLAKNYSLLKYVNHNLVSRNPDEQIFTCWKTNSSSNILLGSSVKLQEDLIYQQPLQFIVQGEERLANHYSIIVHEYALSKEAYEYWENLKKNTELRGSLFDPQPSQVNGNMHSTTDPAEPVLGFVSAGSASSKRIFINSVDLAYWYYVYPFVCGAPLIVPFGDIDSYFYDSLLYVPLDIGLTGVDASNTECGDCRTTGGVNVKPVFFP
ncbi:MAG TPA: DUF4249 domain-containing protein [Puia sp.]|nr:DUF4249 domain-containing protein [Puia sp.]